MNKVWKLIISPEFGERVDLQSLACELMRRIEAERYGAALEWVAVAHHNTEHAHVRVALRGVDCAGQPVRFRREFIQRGIREIAENLCTQQLGYRTEFDAALAERREVDQPRFTSLDRSIARFASHAAAGPTAKHFDLKTSVLIPSGTLNRRNIVLRLMALRRMGLAEAVAKNEWRVRRDFEGILRGMQKVNDLQRTLAAHGVPVS